MSMIEKFLEGKETLRKDLNEIRDEMLKVASDKADERIDKFVEDVKVMVANASDNEFMEFITSGKLEDDDILAAITFRAQSGVKSATEVREEVAAKAGNPVHVFVLGGI